ncbi:hypothetical protein TIFTF001_020704 [Ficus carica]|uniref:Uncharacterized protein n=1 Tax=Ficus carica TaxID=3494 RepID=A0AA88AB95_FICCA|nr:hypothetical protein TIFTF001_020704 [Ficus carica]
MRRRDGVGCSLSEHGKAMAKLKLNLGIVFRLCQCAGLGLLVSIEGMVNRLRNSSPRENISSVQGHCKLSFRAWSWPS